VLAAAPITRLCAGKTIPLGGLDQHQNGGSASGHQRPSALHDNDGYTAGPTYVYAAVHSRRTSGSAAYSPVAQRALLGDHLFISDALASCTFCGTLQAAF